MKKPLIHSSINSLAFKYLSGSSFRRVFSRNPAPERKCLDTGFRRYDGYEVLDTDFHWYDECRCQRTSARALKLITLVMTLLISFALLLALPRTAVSIEITDDLGQKIELKEPARRIIPLYGAFAEMLYDIGAGPEVVARTTADQFPPEIVELPSVGTHMRPNVEMILALKPDLVIQSESRRQATGEMERIRDAGIPIAVFAPESFEGIFSVMKRLGTLTGRESAAQESVDRLEGRLDKVAKRLSGVKKPLRVFFEVRAEPLTGGGRESIVQNILTAAGAENTVKSNKAIVQYNFESLMMSDPDVYIIQRGPMNPNPSDPRRRTHFDRLRSVREGRVIFVDEFLYSRPGPRSVNAVEELAAALYPDLF